MFLKIFLKASEKGVLSDSAAKLGGFFGLSIRKKAVKFKTAAIPKWQRSKLNIAFLPSSPYAPG